MRASSASPSSCEVFPRETPFSTSLCRVGLAAVRRLLRDVLQHDLDAGLRAHVRDRGAHHAGAEHDDLLGAERLDVGAAAARAVDLLEVEEERLDHVLRDLAGREVDEVAALDLERVVEVDLRALDGRGHDVVRRRVVRALDLLAQVGRERRQVHRQRGRRGRAAGDLVLLVGVPRLLRVGVLRDPLLRGRDQVVSRRDQLVDDADLDGLARLHSLTLHQQRHQRVDDPDHADRPHDAAGAGQQAELHLGEAELDLVVVDRDAVVGRERDLQAPAQSGAVQRRDDWLAERLEAAQLRLARAHELGEVLRLVGAGESQVVEVRAGEEGLLRGGDDHALDRVLLGLKAVERRRHRLGVGGVHRVGAGARVVEREDDDAVGVLLPADGGALSGHD